MFTVYDFDKDELLTVLKHDFDIQIEVEKDNFVITYINQVKVDFVKMGYPILFPTLLIDNVRMLNIRDIAAMKLKAIVQRGSKKDFFDIYFLLQQIPLDSLINTFQEKFKQREVFHIIKSLTYFDDAEQYPDPIVFDKQITWEMVKNTIRNEVAKLVQS